MSAFLNRCLCMYYCSNSLSFRASCDDDLASKAEEGAHVEDPDPGKLNAELEMMIKNFQYNTRLFLRAVRDSEEMKTILNELVQVSPMSVQSLGDLHLPLSVSRYEESVPQIILPEGLEKSKGKLMEYLLRFRRSIFADMLTTPEDKKRSKKYMREVLANLHEAQTKVNGLTKELNEIVSRNNEEVKRTTTKVQSLQGEIDNLKRYLEGRRQKINEEENAKRKEIEDENNEKMKKLEKQLADQKTDHQKLIESNQTEEHGERATIYKKESELESEIGKYDQEMTALQEEYDTLDEEYTREKKELNELEERFKTLEEEYLKIMEERRLNEERRQREEEERRLLEKAVTTIQAFWRSYKTRKLIRGGRRGGSRKKK
ncbi:unnamed protein product [Calicophoron daubneyi]|uniref:Dynein regulatory complex protein 10 n=1 Tax=Calicophoron daubneyi TaxID=300641 RepID=A0AAV2TIU0_CALDB